MSSQQPRGLAWVAVAAVSISVGAPAAEPADAASNPPGPSARQKAKERKRLARTVKRDPRAVFRRGFIRRAQFVDFKMPVTMRLNPAVPGGFAPSDDVVEVHLQDASPIAPWPDVWGTSPPNVVSIPPPTASTLNLSGRFNAELDFGADTAGYGRLGVVEADFGGGETLAGSGFTIAQFPDPCPDASNVEQPLLFATGVSFSSGGATKGLVGLYDGSIQGRLLLRAQLNSRRATADTCPPAPPVTYGDTLRSEHPALWSLSFEGQFKMSPAVTADGAIRLGRFTVTDAPPTPQRDAFTLVHSCTVAQAVAPTPSTPPCTAPDDVGFPARVKVKQLTGELLIGNFPG